MKKLLVFIAILLTACSNGIDMEKRWTNSMSQKYPSSIIHIVMTTLPEEDEYILELELKPQNRDFMALMHDIDAFLCNRPTLKSFLIIDTSDLENSTVASAFAKAEAFRKSLIIIHYNWGVQDVDPKAGIRYIDPTLLLINKQDFPNLQGFVVVLAGDKKMNAQNLQLLKPGIESFDSHVITVDMHK